MAVFVDHGNFQSKQGWRWPDDSCNSGTVTFASTEPASNRLTSLCEVLEKELCRCSQALDEAEKFIARTTGDEGHELVPKPSPAGDRDGHLARLEVLTERAAHLASRTEGIEQRLAVIG